MLAQTNIWTSRRPGVPLRAREPHNNRCLRRSTGRDQSRRCYSAHAPTIGPRAGSLLGTMQLGEPRPTPPRPRSRWLVECAQIPPGAPEPHACAPSPTRSAPVFVVSRGGRDDAVVLDPHIREEPRHNVRPPCTRGRARVAEVGGEPDGTDEDSLAGCRLRQSPFRAWSPRRCSTISDPSR